MLADTLRRAKARIADPAHWCQGSLALDAASNPVDWASPRACCFCAQGALFAELGHGQGYSSPAERFLTNVAKDTFDKVPETVNDGLGHDAVMQLYDAAIAQAEVEGL